MLENAYAYLNISFHVHARFVNFENSDTAKDWRSRRQIMDGIVEMELQQL